MDKRYTSDGRRLIPVNQKDQEVRPEQASGWAIAPEDRAVRNKAVRSNEEVRAVMDSWAKPTKITI